MCASIFGLFGAGFGAIAYLPSGYLSRGHHAKDYRIFGSIVGPPILGNYNFFFSRNMGAPCDTAPTHPYPKQDPILGVGWLSIAVA